MKGSPPLPADEFSQCLDDLRVVLGMPPRPWWE